VTAVASARRGLLLAATGFGLGVGTCGLLVPRGLDLDDGLCFYQGQLSTLVPVTVAMASVAVGLWATSGPVRQPVLRRWLRTLAVLAGLVAVPHSWSPLASTAHMVVGSTLFTLALLLGAGATLCPRRLGLDTSGTPAAGVTSLGAGVLAALGALWWTGTPQGYLTWAQIVFMLAVLANFWTWLPPAPPAGPSDTRRAGSGSTGDRGARRLPPPVGLGKSDRVGEGDLSREVDVPGHGTEEGHHVPELVLVEDPVGRERQVVRPPLDVAMQPAARRRGRPARLQEAPAP